MKKVNLLASAMLLPTLTYAISDEELKNKFESVLVLGRDSIQSPREFADFYLDVENVNDGCNRFAKVISEIVTEKCPDNNIRECKIAKIFFQNLLNHEQCSLRSAIKKEYLPMSPRAKKLDAHKEKQLASRKVPCPENLDVEAWRNCQLVKALGEKLPDVPLKGYAQ